MLTVDEQVYGLSLIWSEAKYNFAFWNSRKEIDWNQAYYDTLKSVLKPMTIIDYYLVLSKFISILNDGHTDIYFPKDSIQKLPISISYIDKRHFITNTAKDCKIPLYCELLALNGQEFNKYLSQKIKAYCWNSSNYGSISRAYELIPYIEKTDNFILSTSVGEYTLNKTSEKIIQWNNINTLKSSEVLLNELFVSKSLTIHITSDNIAIISIPTFNDFRIPRNFYKQLDKIKKCRGFIIDIRNNRGGNSNNANAITQAFIDGKFTIGKVRHPIYIGAYKAWGSEMDFAAADLSDPWCKKVYDICTNNYFEEENVWGSYDACPLLLNQPLVILINNKTGSTAENFLISFIVHQRAILVGENSSGSSGNPLCINLPGGGYARICTRKFTYPDNTEFINIGIKPHVYASLSIDDIINAHDSVLDNGLKVLRNQIKKRK